MKFGVGAKIVSMNITFFNPFLYFYAITIFAVHLKQKNARNHYLTNVVGYVYVSATFFSMNRSNLEDASPI